VQGQRAVEVGQDGEDEARVGSGIGGQQRGRRRAKKKQARRQLCVRQ